MNNVRLNLTENEKIAMKAIGTDSDFTTVNMKERSIDSLIEREKTNKFNDQVEQYMDKLNENQKSF